MGKGKEKSKVRIEDKIQNKIVELSKQLNLIQQDVNLAENAKQQGIARGHQTQGAINTLKELLKD